MLVKLHQLGETPRGKLALLGKVDAQGYFFYLTSKSAASKIEMKGDAYFTRLAGLLPIKNHPARPSQTL
ncbi:MAG: hypothetical protein VB099_09855 [Candidatus Limiplasma sp.]|nr:hypothetical protein [Candidatus Limiplasma sp.]